jgi:hypothetical protein
MDFNDKMSMSEMLQSNLDSVTLDPRNFTAKLQAIREVADETLDCDLISQDEWQAIVTRSAKIQDQLNED